MSNIIDPRVVKLALAEVDYFDFEKFAQALCAGVFGVSFNPSGGFQDGGLDGFSTNVSDEYFQFSKTADVSGKIRATINRIRETRGSIKSLNYIGSGTIVDKDKLARDLTQETSVFVSIYDAKWIEGQVNSNDATKAAYRAYLEKSASFLQEFGKSYSLTARGSETGSSLYVFLQQEVERLEGDETISNAVVDSLIKWSLEGTDPDTQSFLDRSSVRTKITDNIPKTENLLNQKLTARLYALSSKTNPGGRGIRHHTKEDEYCLPWELRKTIQEEAIDDATLRLDFEESLSNRLLAAARKFELEVDFDDLVALTTKIIHEVIAKSHVNVLEMLGGDASEPTGLDFSNTIEPECLKEFGKTDQTYSVIDAVRQVLAQIFYRGIHAERRFLLKLSRAYLLQIFLRFDPQAIDHFDSLSKSLNLVVGTDVLIRMMTEVYLEESNQGTTNLLKALASKGATLILTEPVIDELYQNLRSADREYDLEYIKLYQYLTWDIASQPKKILVRSFLYAVLEAREKGDRLYWPNFVEKFCSYNDLHNQEGRIQLREYLETAFSMKFFDREEMEKQSNPDLVDTLVEQFSKIKEEELLAQNDALMIAFVYGLRARHSDRSQRKFGYLRWWLTEETKVISAAKSTISKKGEFALRPDFLFHYLSLDSDPNDSKEAFQSLAMSAVGIKLSNRVASTLVEDTLAKAKRLREMEGARADAELASLNRKVQSTHRKYWDRQQLEESPTLES